MMKRKQSVSSYSWALFWVVCSVFLSSCSQQKGPLLVPVTGSIAFDGEPLENGTISFVPKDGMGGSYGAEIQNGQFHIDLSPGEKTVMISSYRLSKTLKGPDGKPGTEQFVPVRYNDQSQLTATITPEKGQDLEFELASK